MQGSILIPTINSAIRQPNPQGLLNPFNRPKTD
jgi:hypothetical protein